MSPREEDVAAFVTGLYAGGGLLFGFLIGQAIAFLLGWPPVLR